MCINAIGYENITMQNAFHIQSIHETFDTNINLELIYYEN